MAAILDGSLSWVIGIDWTRNLSRHRASRGGSSFIAWSNTMWCIRFQAGSKTFLSLTLHFYFAPWLDTARIGPHTVSISELVAHPNPLVTSTYCLGAVVLTLWRISSFAIRVSTGPGFTLNAMGSLLGFPRRNSWVTS